jgi:uncharacterized protein (DUF1330 family)
LNYIAPDQDDLTPFIDSYPDATPVVMMNRLRFTARADYPAGSAEPCSGGEAYMRYGLAVEPLVAASGGSILWQGSQAAMLIGPQDKDWHLAALVKYPSASAFVDMVNSDDYRAIVFHRTAALEDSRLIAFREL